MSAGPTPTQAEEEPLFITPVSEQASNDPPITHPLPPQSSIYEYETHSHSPRTPPNAFSNPPTPSDRPLTGSNTPPHETSKPQIPYDVVPQVYVAPPIESAPANHGPPPKKYKHAATAKQPPRGQISLQPSAKYNQSARSASYAHPPGELSKEIEEKVMEVITIAQEVGDLSKENEAELAKMIAIAQEKEEEEAIALAQEKGELSTENETKLQEAVAIAQEKGETELAEALAIAQNPAHFTENETKLAEAILIVQENGEEKLAEMIAIIQEEGEAKLTEAIAIVREKGLLSPENEALLIEAVAIAQVKVAEAVVTIQTRVTNAVAIAKETANAVKSGASLSDIIAGLKKHFQTPEHEEICPHCEEVYLRPKIKKKTTLLNLVVGFIFLPCHCVGLYCIFCRKKAVKYCPNCEKPIDPGRFFCQQLYCYVTKTTSVYIPINR